jgi:uncharacterized membrane protein (DUF2068 family)
VTGVQTCALRSELLVDGLLRGVEVNGILEELGESSYFALLERDHLFLPFTIGTLDNFLSIFLTIM